jgi:hypothetical protein
LNQVVCYPAEINNMSFIKEYFHGGLSAWVEQTVAKHRSDKPRGRHGDVEEIPSPAVTRWLSDSYNWMFSYVRSEKSPLFYTTVFLHINCNLLSYSVLLAIVVCLGLVSSLIGDLWNPLKINITWSMLFFELPHTRYIFLAWHTLKHHKLYRVKSTCCQIMYVVSPIRQF